MSGKFLYRFLTDYWNLFNEDDKAVYEAYWGALIQITAELLNKLCGIDLAMIVDRVQLYETSRWNDYDLASAEYESNTEVRIIYRQFPGNDLELSIDLGAKNIASGSVKVYLEPPTEVFVSEYSIDYVNGTITRDHPGGIEAGDWVKIEFQVEYYYKMALPNTKIIEIPVLQELVDDPSITLEENTDYIISDTEIWFRYNDAFITRTFVEEFVEIGTTNIDSTISVWRSGVLLTEDTDYTVSKLTGKITRIDGGAISLSDSIDIRFIDTLWAETTKINNETPYNNFGWLIDFYNINDENYLNALRGLWYAFWIGCRPTNIKTALHLLLNIPVAEHSGTVVNDDATVIEIEDFEGKIATYIVPDSLTRVVGQGDTVEKWDTLTTGIEVYDKINNPEFIEHIAQSTIDNFATQNATAEDKEKAQSLLKEHIFSVRVLAESITTENINNLDFMPTFLDSIKPKYTTYVFQLIKKLMTDDSFTLDELISDSNGYHTYESVYQNLTMTIGYNWVNYDSVPGEEIDSGNDHHHLNAEAVELYDGVTDSGWQDLGGNNWKLTLT